MLTIFSTAKPFLRQDGARQRNALRSWTLLDPKCEVILFGDVPGASEVAAELGIHHVADVLLSERGTVRLDDMFSRAQQIASHDLLCYANCDIMFLGCFLPAVAAAARWSKRFLVVGQRWDTPMERPIEFHADWGMHLREEALRAGRLQFPGAVDYFVFTRGMYRDLPPFVIGRVYWDHWLVWKARSANIPVVDATADVLAIHQNHDHSYCAGGLDGVRADVESKRNLALAGGLRHLYTITHATHRFVRGQIENRPGRWYVPVTFFVGAYMNQFWYWTLKMTFQLRRLLGLRRGGALSQAFERFRSMFGD
jgi:hypothetical protein